MRGQLAGHVDGVIIQRRRVFGAEVDGQALPGGHIGGALAGIAGAGADMGDGHAVGRRAARQGVNERLCLGLGGELLPLTPCVRVVLHHSQAHRVHLGIEVALAGVRLLLLRAQHGRDLVEERGPVDQGLVLLQDRLNEGVGAVGGAVLTLGGFPARLVAVAVELGVDLQIAQRGLHIDLTGDELLEIQQHGVIAGDVAGGRGQAQIALDGCAHIHLLAVDRMGAHRLTGKGEEVTGHHTKRCFNCFVAHGFLLTDFWISGIRHIQRLQQPPLDLRIFPQLFASTFLRGCLAYLSRTRK